MENSFSKMRDITNLNEEDLKEIYDRYKESFKPNKFGEEPNYEGLILIPDTDVWKKSKSISNLTSPAFVGNMFQHMIKIPEIKYIPQDGISNEHLLSEEMRLHLNDSRYTAEWMYPNIIPDVTRYSVHLTDEIEMSNEYYDYFYNIQRSSYGLPRIELKVGSTYILRLGKSSIKRKEMVLVKIENLEKSKFPELYFTEVYNWLGGCDGGVWKESALMNISFGKILTTKKIKEN